MKDVTLTYPLRFATIREGKKYAKNLSKRTGDGPVSIPPFTRNNGKDLVNPKYKNAACEIRFLVEDKQYYVACVKL